MFIHRSSMRLSWPRLVWQPRKRRIMKRAFIASVSIATILGIGQARAEHGVVTAIHAGLNCYEFQLAGSPNWFAIPMLGTGYALQAAEVSNARGTATVIGFDLAVGGTKCSATSPNGQGVVPVPNVANVTIPPLPGQ
jgi:hypothetical protein